MSIVEGLNYAIRNQVQPVFDELIEDKSLTQQDIQTVFVSHQCSLRCNIYNRSFSLLDYHFIVQLLQHGADVNLIKAEGETAITYALTLDMEDQKIALIRLFLKHGLSWRTFDISLKRLLPYDLSKLDDEFIPWIRRYLRIFPFLHCPQHVVPLAVARVVHTFLE